MDDREGQGQAENAPSFLPIGLAAAVAVIALDQASKWWIVNEVMRPPRIIEVTPFFNLVMGWNRGVSFGLLNSDSEVNTWALPMIALAVVVFLLIWLKRANARHMALSLGVIIGGAIGNVIDRLNYNAVADFLDFHVAGYHWPAFNVADAGITVGAAILVLDSLFGGSERHTKENEKDDDANRGASHVANDDE